MGEADPRQQRRDGRGAPRLRRGRLRRRVPAKRRVTRADERTVSRDAVAAVWRIEGPRVIAVLTRVVRDFGLAEDLAHDALVAALETWPRTGVPRNPGAWLVTTAKRRAIDRLRRDAAFERKLGDVAREASLPPDNEMLETDDAFADVDEDLLALVFLANHPVLSHEARTSLTLRALGGLSVAEIARAYLTREATIAQRIVRAKRTLAEANVPFDVPRGAELVARLPSVLEVVYLIFNEGYAATAGDDWMRPALCAEALRLGRVLAGLVPGEAEVHGLVALMAIQASRLRARTAPDGSPVLLLDQDRRRWDRGLIRQGLAALDRARDLGGEFGSYALQAAIAAHHARAATAADTDWPGIAALYDALAEVRPSPVVELNRAVAAGMAFGPAAGLAIADPLVAERSLATSHLLASVRGDLLAKLGRTDEARAEFVRAASLTSNARERDLMLGRAKALAADA